MTRAVPAPGLGPSRRPETDLLICCARTSLDRERTERVRTLLQQQINWPALLRAASRHGLGSLLYWHLNALAPEAVPAPWQESLREHFQETARRNLYLASELLQVLESLAAAAVLAIPYKGPTLAATLYANLALREFSDLDILVPHRQIPQAHDALAAAGFRPPAVLSSPSPAAALRAPGQYQFVRDDGQSLVELHSELTLRYFPVPVDLERLAERAVPLALGAREVRIPSPEDLLLLLAVHGAKDFWEQLKWVCDVAELLRVYRQLDWQRVSEQAAALGLERMLFLALHLAGELLGARLPQNLAARVLADPALPSLAATVCRLHWQDEPAQPGVFERSLFRIRMRPSAWDGIRYWLRLTTTPAEEDLEFARLPAILAPLYVLLRPFRLLGKYGLAARPGRHPHPR